MKFDVGNRVILNDYLGIPYKSNILGTITKINPDEVDGLYYTVDWDPYGFGPGIFMEDQLTLIPDENDILKELLWTQSEAL